MSRLSHLPTATALCVDAHVGKDWAKGLTAATDPRVARMVEARRGKPRGPYRLRRSSDWVWTPELAYAVGLIATDGNLSPSGRHVSVSSAERVVLETFLRCVERTAKIGVVKGGYGDHGLRVQIGDVGLYRWLKSIGLTPRKSLTLGSIKVPDALLPHLLRGLVDGDGSIIDCTYDGTGKAAGRRYRTLLVRFNSASREHAEWVRESIRAAYGLAGDCGARTACTSSRIRNAHRASCCPSCTRHPTFPAFRESSRSGGNSSAKAAALSR